MKLMSWNVNGLRAVLGKDGFAWLEREKPDFLGLQEIKVSADAVPKGLYELEFAQVDTNSASRAGYSGVASLAKFASQTAKCMFGTDEEGRVLEHRFGDVVLFNIYFPNGQKNNERLAYKMKFYADFLRYADELVASGLGVIFCGDVNTAHNEIDLANPKANSKISGFLPIERAWLDEVTQHGYIDTFRAVHGDVSGAYSWWSYRFNARAKNVGWRIDYFFISENLKSKLKDAFICADIMGSDHCPIGIEIDL